MTATIPPLVAYSPSWCVFHSVQGGVVLPGLRLPEQGAVEGLEVVGYSEMNPTS